MGLCLLCLNIDLSNTAITDAGFQKLETLRFLNNLNLTGTKVSRAAVDAFKKKRAGDTNVPKAELLAELGFFTPAPVARFIQQKSCVWVR